MESSSARHFNRAAVLDAVFAEAGVTRAGISGRTGLSPATVSRVVEDLIAEGLLDEGQQIPRTGRGRRSTFLTLGRGVGCVVGIDLGATTCRLRCNDLMGEELRTLRRPTPRGLEVPALVDWLAESVTTVMAESGTSRPLIGIVVAVPATVRDAAIVVRPARQLAQTEGAELGHRLGRALGVPVLLDNDSNLALVGEMATGAAVGCTDAVILTTSTDFDAGVAVNGEILRGRTGIVGEFATLPTGDEQPLRRLLSVDGILDTAAEQGVALADFTDLFDSAPEGPLGTLRRGFVHGLTLATSVATLAYDPQVIVVQGRLQPLVEQVLPELRERLSHVLPAVPELRPSALGGFAGATGAAFVAVQAARTALKDLGSFESWLSPQGTPLDGAGDARAEATGPTDTVA
ncbi:ROK family protein [Streptomyces sp. NPDC012616]|uniref:ROK family transcriptional regulator n=1 Tax=Streptomyces sp. NPDC012616 TaxID=3364840 RepID=UPI0036E260B9